MEMVCKKLERKSAVKCCAFNDDYQHLPYMKEQN